MHILYLHIMRASRRISDVWHYCSFGVFVCCCVWMFVFDCLATEHKHLYYTRTFMSNAVKSRSLMLYTQFKAMSFVTFEPLPNNPPDCSLLGKHDRAFSQESPKNGSTQHHHAVRNDSRSAPSFAYFTKPFYYIQISHWRTFSPSFTAQTRVTTH